MAIQRYRVNLVDLKQTTGTLPSRLRWRITRIVVSYLDHLAEVKRLKTALQRLVNEIDREFEPSSFETAMDQARAALRER